MSAQARMAELIGKLGIPSKRIHVYGGEIVITTFSHGAAQRFAIAISDFAKVWRVMQSWDESREHPNAKPKYSRVWRVFARVKTKGRGEAKRTGTAGDNNEPREHPPIDRRAGAVATGAPRQTEKTS